MIFSDISEDCLSDCRAVAGNAASYHRASADDLGDVEANVVTTRSVLIYVADKQRAFDEFFRVLLPGGRLSIFEPINRFGLQERATTGGFGTLGGAQPLLAKVIAEMSRAERDGGGLSAMTDFDERDLLTYVEAAGFDDIRLTLIAEVSNREDRRPRDWSVFLDSSPNPLAPTVGEAMREALTTTERDQLTQVIRPQVEQGLGHTRAARAFLTARRPRTA